MSQLESRAGPSLGWSSAWHLQVLAHFVYGNNAPFPDRLYYRRWPDFD